MLKIEDLWVSIDGKEISKGVNLHIPVGETHVLFGKNGSGKSTLLMTVIGFQRYQMKQGKIYLQGRDITELPTYERARLGLGLAFQRPPPFAGSGPKTSLPPAPGPNRTSIWWTSTILRLS